MKSFPETVLIKEAYYQSHLYDLIFGGLNNESSSMAW